MITRAILSVYAFVILLKMKENQIISVNSFNRRSNRMEIRNIFCFFIFIFLFFFFICILMLDLTWP